ncbi:MAG: ABC transporter substrate-binding protein [Chloroflexota bacterium]
MISRTLVATLVISGTVLAGCRPVSAPSGASTGGGGLTRDATGTQAQQCEAGKEWWRSTDAPKQGGVFRVLNPVPIRPYRLDPTAPGQASIVNYPQIYERLVRPRACFYEDTVMEPALAESWTTSPDGLTWTFKLRENANWQNVAPVNGRAFTSADVAFTIEHQKAGGNLKSFWDSVTHEEPDAQTIILRIKEPDADFLGKLGEGQNFIVPREVKDQFGDFKNIAIGTGPYMMKDFQPDQVSTLVRNPNWWGAKGPNGQTFQRIDEIQIIKVGDYVADVAAMRSGQADLNASQGYNRVDADALKQANPKMRSMDDVSSTIWNIYFNLNKKPFDDVRVRRAIAFAVDFDEVNLGGDFQGGGIRSGFLSSTLKEWGWPPEKVAEKFKPDREKARQLLSEAGYGPGDIKILLEVGKAYTQGAEVIQKQLESVGITARLQPDAGDRSSIGIMRDPQFESSWGAYTGSSFFPDYWLSAGMHSKGSVNSNGLKDAQLDTLIDAQRKEMDPAKRKVVIDQIQDRLYDVMPSVPGLAKIYYRFYSCQVRNMRPTQSNRDLEGIHEAWIDATGC